MAESGVGGREGDEDLGSGDGREDLDLFLGGVWRSLLSAMTAPNDDFYTEMQ